MTEEEKLRLELVRKNAEILKLRMEMLHDIMAWSAKVCAILNTFNEILTKVLEDKAVAATTLNEQIQLNEQQHQLLAMPTEGKPQ